MSIEDVKNDIRDLLADVNHVSDKTLKEGTEEIVNGISATLLSENEHHELAIIPLEPDLVAYCFSEILGFKVERRIFEKIDYIIEFDYKGTFASIRHSKLSYRLNIAAKYKTEFLITLEKTKPLMEQLFILLAEQSLSTDDFSMKNEAPEYLSKLEFYQKRIEVLEDRRKIITEKLHGQYDVIKLERGECWKPKGQEYLSNLSKEIEYDIEAYIDTFYSAIEHILTMLYPFIAGTGISFYKDYLRNTKWTWKAKIDSVCGSTVPTDIVDKLDKIKEVYRNHNAHGAFSREMMAYIQIPNFGRFPIYIGKKYLKGFAEGESDSVTFDMYLSAKKTFCDFIGFLDSHFSIPMLMIRSGLPIPTDTSLYMNGITSKEDAEEFVDKMWYEIYNQFNMDW